MTNRKRKNDRLDLRKSSIKAARDLLGQKLCRRVGQRIYKLRITETEAYEGWQDRASHASRGKTKRNVPMFEKAGTIYVYFTYGMHYMLNIVCGKVGHPSAVLIRGVEGISGPGRLTKKLKIDKKLNGKLLSKKTGLWIEPPRKKLSAQGGFALGGKIIRRPRVGVAYAGPVWSKKLYRFVLK